MPMADQARKIEEKIKQKGLHTSSQVGKADLRDSKALSELTSVVFWERTVLTKPSKTVSLDSPSKSSDFRKP